MKNICLVVLSFVSITAAAQSTATIYGTISDMAGKKVDMTYDNDLNLLGTSRDQMLDVDSAGNFSLTFPLDRPSFFRLRRNTIYLSPGDNLKANLTSSNLDAVFEGTSQELNTYMKKRLFPKGGSFLGNIGRANLSLGFDAIKFKIDSLATLRRVELANVKEASPAFKDLEQARITADVINSYQSYLFYYNGGDKFKDDGNQVAFKTSLLPIITPLLQSINEDKYMDVAVVRDVLSKVYDDSIYKQTIELKPRIKTLFQASEYADILDRKFTEQDLNNIDSYLGQLPVGDIRDELQKKRNSVDILSKGHVATDLKLATPDGKEVLLSSYKGKVIYVDLWATWCGPCIKESPYFHSLAEKYKDKNIVFLAVSTDTEKKSWLKFLEKKESHLPEFISIDNEALKKGWKLKFIPRFLLIAPDFTIIDAYAPLPSSGEKIESLLEQYL